MNPWLARNFVYRPATWLRGERVFPLLRSYEEMQWWSESQLREWQHERVTQMLRHAGRHSRFHRERMRDAGVDPENCSSRDLSSLPLFTKSELVNEIDEICVKRPPGSTSWKTTGGSTGLAVRLRKNRAATAAEQAVSWRSYGWYGVGPGDRQARFWGVPALTKARLRYATIDAILNRVRFSAFAFSEADLMQYFERVRTARPAWAYGYVSMLVQFADFCLSRQLPLASVGVRAVVTTSEVLSESDRAIIEKAFGAPVYNEYGCGEVGAILYECERGSLHAMMESVLTELLPDPTPDEPMAHRLVVTDLHNLATPLIRYDVGDRVVPADGCACGRGLTAFKRVFGRAYDMVEAADGRRFHGEFFLYIVEEARDRGLPVRQAQFVQTERDRIEIRLVPLATSGAEEAAKFIAEQVEKRTSSAFFADVELVSEIERERSGKIRLIKGLS